MTDNSRLKSFIDRIENLLQEKAIIAEDIKEIYVEVKSAGYDGKAIRRIIKDRAADAQAMAELEEIVDLYKRELGMLADTPLGQSALQEAS